MKRIDSRAEVTSAAQRGAQAGARSRRIADHRENAFDGSHLNLPCKG
ncbi:MAG: hypothetical protein ACXWNU_12100 [Candidatus Binataceae bacterium]